MRGGAPTRFYHYLISTEYRYDEKDPSAPLGMTIRETAFLIFPFIPQRFQPPPLRGTSFHGKEGECRFPMKKTYDTRIPLSPISSFRAKREIFLAQRSKGERERRSAHAILSLPHKYRVPLRRKRSLGSARDDDTRDRFPHIPFYTSAIPTSAPSGHLLPWEGGRMPLPHEEDLRYENTAFPHIVISSKARNLPCTTVKR